MPVTIDVMLPYYGDVGYFKIAVESVLAQDSDHWRLVIVDDGFPDPEPARWSTVLAERDPRVVYHRNPQNLGANGNYRRAVELVEAPYFVMMGADDVMLPGFVSEIERVFASVPEADVVQPGVAIIDARGNEYLPLADRVKRWYSPRPAPGSIRVLRGQTMARSLVRADWAYFPSLAWRSDRVRAVGFRTGLDVVQDLALLLDIASLDGALVAATQVVFQYRRHSASDSSVRAFDGRRFVEERDFFRAEAVRFAEMGWASAARAARRRTASRLHCLVTALSALRRGRLADAARLLSLALGR